MGVSPHRRLNLGAASWHRSSGGGRVILCGLGVRHVPITFAWGSFSSKFAPGLLDSSSHCRLSPFSPTSSASYPGDPHA